MAEIFDDDTDLSYWEHMGQESEAAPEAEGTPAEEPVAEEAPAEVADTAEEETADRPRDEKGRFVKQQEETVEEAQERLLAGKYKSADELEAAYAELQSRFGQQGSELGELRRAIEERFAGLEQAVNRPQAPGSWDDLIDTNPAQALELAYQRGDQLAMQRAALAVEEVSPGYVVLWSQNKQLEERLAQIDQRTQPVIQESAQQARARAYLNVKAKNPDIEEHLPAIQEVATKYPQLVAAVETGTAEEAEGGWEALLALAKAGKADTLRETAQQVARNAAQAEQRAREEAVVASAATVQTEVPKKNLAEQIGQEWDSLEAPYRDGWPY